MKQVSVKGKLVANLKGLPMGFHNAVVQQTTFDDQGGVWTLQVLNDLQTAVSHAQKGQGTDVQFDTDKSRKFSMDLQGQDDEHKAGCHTQTLEASGEPNKWFVGTSPKFSVGYWWSQDVARIDMNHGPIKSNFNTDFPRLTDLNLAGKGYNNDEACYDAKDMQRVEVSVSPNFKHLLVATLTFDHTAHFGLYDLDEVNKALDKVEASKGTVSCADLHCLGAFVIPKFNKIYMKSVQGFGLADDDSIYVPSQLAPRIQKDGSLFVGSPREIFRIPWGETNADNWEQGIMDDNKELDLPDCVTEFEGVHATSDGQVLLTIAYHKKPDLPTVADQVFKVKGL